MVDLLPSPDQVEIIDQTQSFLKSRLPVARLKGDGDGPVNHERAVWRDMAAAGWFGIAASEEDGGVGLSLVEEMLVFRELGRFLVSPAVLATALAARLAIASGEGTLARAFIDGSAVAAPMLRSAQGVLATENQPFGLSLSKPAQALRQAQGERPLATHENVLLPKLQAQDGTAAEYLVLALDDATHLLYWDAEGAHLLSRDALRSARERPGLDTALRLHRAGIDLAQAIVHLPASTVPLHRIATVLTSAMLVGIAEATGDIAAEHARTREQFGRRIGEFQAVKHGCANMRVRSEVALWQVVFAALSQVQDGADAAFQAASAKILASNAALENGAANIQLHGGMGFTADLGAHSFLRRAHLLHRLGGDTRHHQRALLAQPAPS